MTKTITDMNDEIAKLNSEIKRLRLEAKIDRAKTRLRNQSSTAHTTRAKERYKVRQAKLRRIRARVTAKTYSERKILSSLRRLL